MYDLRLAFAKGFRKSRLLGRSAALECVPSSGRVVIEYVKRSIQPRSLMKF